jgi:hypothetical protein
MTELSRLEEFVHKMYKDGGDGKLEPSGFGVLGLKGM